LGPLGVEKGVELTPHSLFEENICLTPEELVGKEVLSQRWAPQRSNPLNFAFMSATKAKSSVSYPTWLD